MPLQERGGQCWGGDAGAGFQRKAQEAPTLQTGTEPFSSPFLPVRLRAALSELSQGMWALPLPGSSGSRELVPLLVLPGKAVSVAALFTGCSPERSGTTLTSSLKEKEKQVQQRSLGIFLESLQALSNSSSPLPKDV